MGNRVCCDCRGMNQKGKGSGSTENNLSSCLSVSSTLKLLQKRGRWGSRCRRADAPSALGSFSPVRPLLSTCLLFSVSPRLLVAPLQSPLPQRLFAGYVHTNVHVYPEVQAGDPRSGCSRGCCRQSTCSCLMQARGIRGQKIL